MGEELVKGLFTRSENTEQGESGDDSKEDYPPFFFKKLFEREFPYYLSIGMSASEYWDGSSSLTVAYRKAENLRKERVNAEAHLQAFYIYEVIADFVPVLVSFPKKGAKPGAFRDKPIDLGLETFVEEKKPERDKEKDHMSDIKAKMFAFAERRRKAKEEKYNAEHRQS